MESVKCCLLALGYLLLASRPATSKLLEFKPSLLAHRPALVATPATLLPFSDVPLSHPAYPAVRKLFQLGILQGRSHATFQGDRPLTRYEAAVLFERVLDHLLQTIPIRK